METLRENLEAENKPYRVPTISGTTEKVGKMLFNTGFVELEEKMVVQSDAYGGEKQNLREVTGLDTTADNEASHCQVGPVLGPAGRLGPPLGWPHPVAVC